MPKYKLRVPERGTILYGDGDKAVVADDIEEARETFRIEYDEDAPYLHSYIGRCEVLYKADIDNGDCHDDAEPGDTTVWYTPDDGRELDRRHECRVWMLGPPRVSWSMRPTAPRAIDLPVGTKVIHDRLGEGKTTSLARMEWGPNRATIDVEFESGRKLACSATTLRVVQTFTGPRLPRRYELTIEGEVVGEGLEEDMEALRRERVEAINDAWKAEQDAQREVIPA